MTNPATITSLSDCRAQIETVTAKKDELDMKHTAQGKVVKAVLYSGLAVGVVCTIAAGGLPLLQAAGYLPQISAAMIEMAHGICTVAAGIFGAFMTVALWIDNNHWDQTRECGKELNALEVRKYELIQKRDTRRAITLGVILVSAIAIPKLYQAYQAYQTVT